MKKFLLLICIALFTTGCKKEVSEVMKMNDGLIGTWSVVSNKIVYYNQSGQKEYEEILEDVNIVSQIIFMKGLKATLIDNNVERLDTRYNLIEENTAIYLELFNASIFDAGVWKISGNAIEGMSWTANFSNLQYENKETGEITESPKAILTLNLKKL